jgi:hypothetical protein
MMRVMKAALLLGAMLASAAFCQVQVGVPVEGPKAAAIEQLADQFVERLHQNPDVGAQNEMFLPGFAGLHRTYPGEFQPFDTPRLSLSLLKATDDATMRRKLLAEWNLHYWRWVLLTSQPAPKGNRPKMLPSDFLKAARKSQYMKCLTGEGSTTLTSPEELAAFLNEADQVGAVLKKNVLPEMFGSEALRLAAEKARSGNAPQSMPGIMGFDRVYTVAREAMLLVMVEKDNQLRLLSIAPLAN